MGQNASGIYDTDLETIIIEEKHVQIETKFPATLKQVRKMTMTASSIARRFYGAVMDETQMTLLVQDIELTVGEACTNSVNHSTCRKPETVILRCEPSQSVYRITVMDMNPEFDFNNAPLPDFSAVPESGYGIHIIKQKTDQAGYRRENGWNMLTMMFRIPESPGNSSESSCLVL